jgi:putative DNA primase/helicase
MPADHVATLAVERGLLGLCLVDPAVLAAADDLEPGMFLAQRHGILFAALRTLAQARPGELSPVGLVLQLQEAGTLASLAQARTAAVRDATQPRPCHHCGTPYVHPSRLANYCSTACAEADASAYISALVADERALPRLRDHLIEKVREMAARRAVMAGARATIRAARDVTTPLGEAQGVALLPPSPTDDGNGRLFASRYAAQVRFVHDLNTWLVWDELDACWRPDITRRVELLAKSIGRDMYQRAYGQDTQMRHAIDSLKLSAIRAMLGAARSEPGIALTSDALDADGDLLHTSAGTVDTRSGELLAPDPARLITKLAGVPYRPDATCPRWERFLSEITRTPDGHDDPELAAYLQRAAGYSAVADSREHVLFVAYGAGGNGKSTFLNTLAAALGDYTGHVASAALVAQRDPDRDGPSPALVALRGARFVMAVETSDAAALNEPLVKALSDGSYISPRPLYGPPVTFRTTCKVWLASNHKPRIRGTDEGIWRRLQLVPFDLRLDEEQRDHELEAHLMEELPGILAWIVRGTLEWRRIGLRPPARVRAATAAYRTNMDILGAWIAERCVEGAGAEASAAELYRDAEAYFAEVGERALSQRALGMRLEERGYTRFTYPDEVPGHHKRNTVGYRGIALLRACAAPAPAPPRADAISGLLPGLSTPPSAADLADAARFM